MSRPQIETSPADRVFGIPVPTWEPHPAEGSLLQPPRPIVEPSGNVPAGMHFVHVDFSIGLAILHEIPLGARCVTSHLHLHLVPSPLLPDAGIRGRPAIDALSQDSATAAAVLVGAGDRPVGRASSRFQILQPSDRAGADVDEGSTDTGWGRRAGTPEVIAGVSEVGSVDVDTLLGLSIDSRDAAVTRLRARAFPELANGRGGYHGGVGGLLTERSATLAVQEWVGAARTIAATELRVFFARPIAANGQPLLIETTLRRLGRTVALTSTSVRTHDGRDALFADAIHVVD